MGGKNTKVEPTDPKPEGQKGAGVVTQMTANTAKRMRPKHTLDKSLENGPTGERHCTDVLCYAMFVVMLGLVFYIMGTAFSRGDPWKLAQPFDVDANPCGAVNSITTVILRLPRTINSLTSSIPLWHSTMWFASKSARTGILKTQPHPSCRLVDVTCPQMAQS